jgi:putative addiction module killer protein
MYTVLQYQTAAGVKIYEQWVWRLKDRQFKARLAARIDRLRNGHTGDAKPVGGGVYELRIDHGPGYRVYYVQSSDSRSCCYCAAATNDGSLPTSKPPPSSCRTIS